MKQNATVQACGTVAHQPRPKLWTKDLVLMGLAPLGYVLAPMMSLAIAPALGLELMGASWLFGVLVQGLARPWRTPTTV